MLEGKLRPQFDRVDGRPDKVPLSTKTDVKLREKRKDFEQRDYQAQRVMNVHVYMCGTFKPMLVLVKPSVFSVKISFFLC